MDASILTPKDIVFSGNLDFLIIPGVEGDLGILDNHSHLITTIRTGIVYCYKEKKILKKYLLDEGIFEFSNNKATLLTEFIEELDQAEKKIRTTISQSGNQDNIEGKLKLKEKLNLIDNQYYV